MNTVQKLIMAQRELIKLYESHTSYLLPNEEKSWRRLRKKLTRLEKKIINEEE